MRGPEIKAGKKICGGRTRQTNRPVPSWLKEFAANLFQVLKDEELLPLPREGKSTLSISSQFYQLMPKS